MTRQLPTSSTQAAAEPVPKAKLGAGGGPRGKRSYMGRSSTLLRKLSIFAPLATAYASFQAVLSSLPPSLSYANMHYLLAMSTDFEF